jgi:hypothetical protein
VDGRVVQLSPQRTTPAHPPGCWPMPSRGGPVAASTIVHALALPRSRAGLPAARRTREHGFVLHFPEAGEAGIGIAAFGLSSGLCGRSRSHLGQPILSALVDRLGEESAHLAVLHGRDVVYLVERRAPRRPTSGDGCRGAATAEAGHRERTSPARNGVPAAGICSPPAASCRKLGVGAVPPPA